jgi:hypothetical protein
MATAAQNDQAHVGRAMLLGCPMLIDHIDHF